MKKTYKISNIINFWDCTVEIDDSHPSVEDVMREIILFCEGGENRLDDNKGDLTRTFLQQLGRKIFLILSSYRWNTRGVIAQFEDLEGWCKMDGSYGIKIIDTDVVEFVHSDFEVEEVSA